MEAGLPNIKGSLSVNNGFGDCFNRFHLKTGCFYELSTFKSAAAVKSNVGITANNLGFDASRSSSIYGNHETVTPLSLSCKIVLKY